MNYPMYNTIVCDCASKNSHEGSNETFSFYRNFSVFFSSSRCAEALKRNKTLIQPDQREYQKDLENKFTKFTDDVDPQWKQVVIDSKIKPNYALSHQAKGKIERPYQWLQDRVIRTCIRDNVKDINHGQRILNAELDRYNHKQVHSTTEEIPYNRFQNAKDQNKSLFREFKVPAPFLTHKDIFCLRTSRTADPYCKININDWSFRLKDAEPRQFIDIRAYALDDRFVELRFWHRGKFLEATRVKMADLGLSTFYL